MGNYTPVLQISIKLILFHHQLNEYDIKGRLFLCLVMEQD